MPLKEVAAGDGRAGDEEPKVDIIAVHGLNPWGNPEHALDTWRKPKGANGNLWLRDELPKTVPHARIFLYSFDSSPAFGSSKERFVHQANDLLERIHIKRADCEKRPIILIGHSLGGILIKQALVNAHSNTRYTPIKQASSGLVFFGTPHAGGKDALVSIGKLSARVATSILQNPSKDVMEALTKGSLFSDVLQESWRHQLNLYKIVSFYEGIGDIVPRESAVLGLSGDVENQVRLEADHSNICCFDFSVEDDLDNYEVVAANIKELYKASLKRKDVPIPSQNADLEAFTTALKTQGGGDAMNLLASYITPNPQDYENPELDYTTALSRDCKRNVLHLIVLRYQPGLRRSGFPNHPGQPVNNVNSNGDNPFHTAATLGKGEACAVFFLKQNVLINAKNNQGNTVLHLYILAQMQPAEKLSILSLLLQHRANPSIENRDGLTPLHLAVKGSQVDVVRLLLDHGAPLTPGPGKLAALHVSCAGGDVEVTKVLLEKGANVGWVDEKGLTALHVVCQQLAKGDDVKGGYMAIWTLLKKHGGDEEVKDQSGMRPRDIWAGGEMQGPGAAGVGSSAGLSTSTDGWQSGTGGYQGGGGADVPAGGYNSPPGHSGAPYPPTNPAYSPSGSNNLGGGNGGSRPGVPAGGYNSPPLGHNNSAPYPTPTPAYSPSGSNNVGGGNGGSLAGIPAGGGNGGNLAGVPAGGYNSPPPGHNNNAPYPPPNPAYSTAGSNNAGQVYPAYQGYNAAAPGSHDGRPEASRTKSFQNYMSGGQGAEDLRSVTQKFSQMSSPLKGWGRKKA